MPDESENAKAKAERDAAWWEKWWTADYSWNGLAKLKPNGEPDKPWAGWSVSPDDKLVETVAAPRGSRAATLQDYYRRAPSKQQRRNEKAMRTANLLVEADGQPAFHILHLPPRYRNGSETWKANPEAAGWAELETEAARLVADGARTEFDAVRELEGADRRTQLQGAVLRTFPRPLCPSREDTHPSAHPCLHLIATFAAFLGDCNAGGLNFASATDFVTCGFFGHADFRNAKFSGGDIYFANAHFSGGYADFIGTHFSGGDADFMGAQFSGGDAYFRSAQFSRGHTNFHNAKFSGGDVYFKDVQFGRAILDPTDIGLPPLTPAWFEQPSTASHFDWARFTHRFSAVGARFLGPASFRGTRFERTALFGDDQKSILSSQVVRKGAFFRHETSFRDAQFKALAGFARCQFPRRADHRNAAFEGTRFFESLDFKGVERLPFSAFRGALLDKGILIGPGHPKQDQFRDALADARRAADRDDAIKGKPDYNKKRDPDFESRFTDARFAALEAGCGVLKHAMMQTSDRQREQSFYRMELIARRHRPVRSKANPDASVTWWEAFASRLYGWVSDYGGSAMRPLAAALLALPLTFGASTLAAYAIFNQANAHAPAFAPSPGETVLGAFGLAWRNALTPFHAWSESFGTDPDSFAHAFHAATGHAGFDFLLGACHLQSLLSVILVFLAGLALRRKFQIS